MNELVRQIQDEKDRAKLTTLVEELNDLISKKEHSFPSENSATHY